MKRRLPYITLHAFDRLRERFGWSGDKVAAAHALMALDGVRAGIATHGGTDARWFCIVAEMDARLIFMGERLVTVTDLSTFAAHKQSRRNRAGRRPSITFRTGSRGKRSPRPQTTSELEYEDADLD